MERPVRSLLLVLALVASAFGLRASAAQAWMRLGPEGGQVISLAAGEKDEVFLGTADGHVFVSIDGGQNWKLRGHLSERWDAVVRAMVVDTAHSQRIFAGVWYQDPEAGGGIFWSEDGGASWQRRGLEGEAVRALAQWSRDGKVLVAGTKTGIFRTKDAGATWERISPKDDAELKNLDSIAIDPRNANVIYAGTFHLPWKTTDGGNHWNAIADGMIDDSDIMSVVIDAKNPERVFASACSGIYRSESGGRRWTKLEGIPYVSRRTQQIVQDPANPSRWFAGTTEGLWETSDGGETWERVLGREASVNALVFAKESGVLILGTDDGLRVAKGGSNRFPTSERGFSHRVLTGSATQGPDNKHFLVAIDGTNPEMLESIDGGATWRLIAMPNKAVLRLFSLQDRWIASLRRGGAAVLDASRRWKEWRFFQRTGTAVPKANVSKGRVPRETEVFPEIRALAAVGGRVFVATEAGLWSGGMTEGVFRKVVVAARPESFVDVVAQGGATFAVTGTELWKSEDGGKHWERLPAPKGADQLLWARFVSSAPKRVLLGTASGVFLGEFSAERNSLEWRLLQSGLPAMATENGWIGNGLWAVASRAGSIYISRDEGANWERLEEVTAGAVQAIASVASDGIYVETRADGMAKFAFGRVAALNSRNGTLDDVNSAKHE